MYTPAVNQQSYSLHSSQQYSMRVGLASASPHNGSSEGNLGVGVGQRQDAFERTLSMGYIKLAESMSVSVESPAAAFDTGQLTSEKVAGNILGFIERRLALDKADGASADELTSRLEAGLKGFKQGFAEAQEQLKALDMLTPEIAADIGKTHDLVIAGIEDLREKFLGVSAEDTAEERREDTAELARSTLAAGQYDYARANSFSFTLKTADGDTVTIDAKAAQSMSISEAYARDEGGKQSYSLSASYSSSNAFDLSIEGDLDEGELKAINELLGQVNNLADDFFAGDLDSAFDAALELGYNSEEITSYSLNLTQVEVQRVATAYQAGADRGAMPELGGVGQFAQDLLGAFDMASEFSEPLNLIKQITEQLAEMNGDSERLPGFVNRMLEDLSLA